MKDVHTTYLAARTRRRSVRLAIGLALAATSAWASAQGLPLASDDASSPWRGTSTSNAFAGLSLARAHAGTQLHLFSDYYFYDAARGSLGPTLGGILGGFRASTGTAAQPIPLSLFDNVPESNQSLPYLGLGYSQLWLNNSLRLNADMGLSTQSPWTSPHLHNQANGTPSLDDLTRDVRWAPVMSVSLGYRF